MVRFGRVAPSVPVKDLHRALQFYRDLLGFDVQFTNGDPISFAIVTQGDAELHLGVQPAKAGSFHAHLMVDDLDGVHERLKQAGARSGNRRRFSHGACATWWSLTRTGTASRSPKPSATKPLPNRPLHWTIPRALKG